MTAKAFHVRHGLRVNGKLIIDTNGEWVGSPVPPSITDAIQRLDDLLDVSAGSPTIGAILYSDGTNWLKLPRGTSGQVLTMGSPLLPSWQAAAAGGGSPNTKVNAGSPVGTTLRWNGTRWVNNTLLTSDTDGLVNIGPLGSTTGYGLTIDLGAGNTTDGILIRGGGNNNYHGLVFADNGDVVNWEFQNDHPNNELNFNAPGTFGDYMIQLNNSGQVNFLGQYGTLASFVNGGGGGIPPSFRIFTGATMFMQENANALADTAGYGQIWVRTATPNQLWFTNDAGTDTRLDVIPVGSPSIGNILYDDGSGAFVRLPRGTAGQVLTMGSPLLPTWKTAAGGSSGSPNTHVEKAGSPITINTAGIADNQFLRIYDSGNTDYADFFHDGTNFNTTLTNTTEWVVDLGDGSTNFALERSDTGSRWRFNMAGDDLRIFNSGGAGSDILFSIDSGSSDTGNNVGIGDATPSEKLSVWGSVGVWDTGGTDNVIFSHDGTDINIAGTNAAAINFTGPNEYNFQNQYRVYPTLTRSVPTVVGDVIDIGTLAVNAGGFVVHLDVTVPDAGFSVSKAYIVPINYAETVNVWEELVPIADGGVYSGNNYAVDINVNINFASFRIRRTAGSTAGTASITMTVTTDNTSYSWTPSTATSTVGSPAGIVYYAATGVTTYDNTIDLVHNTNLIGGNTLTIEDSTGSDNVAFSHDGTDFAIAGTNTTMINVSGVTALQTLGGTDIDVRDAGVIRFRDSADTQYVSISHDSTNANFTAVGTTAFRFQNAATYIQGSATGLRVYDQFNTDYGQFSHDGTDFNTSFNNTTDWNIGLPTGAIRFGSPTYAIVPGSPTSVGMKVRNLTTGTGLERVLTTSDLSAGGSSGSPVGFIADDGLAFGTGSPKTLNVDNTVVRTTGGTQNRIPYWSDSTTLTDDADFTLDGLTLSIGNATGSRELLLDANATTARSYISTKDVGGTARTILQRDSSADNLSLGSTFFGLELIGGGTDAVHTTGTFRFYNSGKTQYNQYNIAGNNFNNVFSGITDFTLQGLTGNLWVRDGAGVRISDSTDSDHATFFHDGTDFNLEFGSPLGTGTTDWNIRGIAALIAGNYNFNIDQTVGAGQDNYVLTYDNGTGQISLEAAAGGGGGSTGSPAGYVELTGSPKPATAKNVGSITLDGPIILYGSPETEQGEIGMVAGNLNFNAIGSPPRTRFQKDGVTKAVFNYATDTFWLEDGTDFQMYGPTDTGNVIFSHDDTDFNTTFAGSATGKWNIGKTGTGSNESAIILDGAIVLHGSPIASSNASFQAAGAIQNHGTGDNVIAYMGVSNSLTTAEFGGYNWTAGAYRPVIINGSSISLREDNVQVAVIDNSDLLMSSGSQFLADDGAAATPGIAFTTATTTGFYEAGGSIGVSNATNLTAQFSATHFLAYQTIWGQDGFSVSGNIPDVGQVGTFAFVDTTGSPVTGRHGAYNYDTGTWQPVRLAGISAEVAAIGDGAFTLPGDNTAEFTGLGDKLWLRDGMNLRVGDVGDTDWVEMDHDGTNFNMVGTNTLGINISGLIAGVTIRDGVQLIINDSTNADNMWCWHDGTDFNTGFNGTTDWNIATGSPGLTSFNVGNYNFDVDQTVGAGQDNYVLTYDNADGQISLEPAPGGGDAFLAGSPISTINANSFALNQSLRIYDSGNTDYAEFSHDGTDFNTAFTNTADWNITGLSSEMRLRGGASLTVEDGGSFSIFDAGNTDAVVMSHDGTNFNTTFTTTSLWEFDMAGLTSGVSYTEGANAKFFIDKANTIVDVRDGWSLRVRDSGDTDYADFNHDGTNFNFDFVNTSNVDMAGAAALQMLGGMDVDIRDAGLLRIRDTGDTDYVEFQHDGTDFNMTFTNVTDWNISDLGQNRVHFNSTAGGSRLHVGGDSTGYSVIVGQTQHGGSPNVLNYRAYFAYDSYWNEATNEWEAVRTSLGRKYMMDMGYHNNSVRFRRFDGTVTSPWADSAWTDMLTIDGGNARVDLGNTYNLRWITGSGIADFDHTGTDFTTTFTSTTDWEIGSGLSGEVRIENSGGLRLRSGADLFINTDDNVTTAYLIQPGATSSNDVTITANAGIQTQLGTAGVFAVLEGGTNKLQIDHNNDRMWLRDGYTLRVSDSGDTDYVEFSHDGTDFNVVGTNTTSINFTSVDVEMAAGDRLAINWFQLSNQEQGTYGGGATPTSGTMYFDNNVANADLNGTPLATDSVRGGIVAYNSDDGWGLVLDTNNIDEINLSNFTNDLTTITVADESADTTCFPLFVTAATGALQPKTGSNMTFNSATGHFTATSKSFLIDHPTKPGKKLQYGSLEGPENGVYVRGRLTDDNEILLPDYWTGLVDADTITVQLTPIGSHQNLYVHEIKDNKVIVGGVVDCFYTVYGERKDVDKLIVEFE